MVDMSKPLTAGKAGNYYKEEYSNAENSYYTQGKALQGHWHGKFAEELGLTGAVTEEQFARMALGQNPENGEQWIQHRNTVKTENGGELEHRAGWDLTFNAPKTVSLAALPGHDERVRQAHAESVVSALNAGQEYMQARMGGNNPSQTTGKWAAAMFEHDTARPDQGYPAPHLHTHVVVFNMTRTEDGQVRSVQPSELYRVQSYMTAVYQNELALKLKELGYELTPGTNHAPDIKGFTKDYLEAESQRSQRIRLESEDRGVDGREARERIAHAVRENKLKWTPEEVHKAHREHQEMFGGQADMLVKESLARDAVIVSREQSNAQAEASLDFAAAKLAERSAVFEQWEVYREALRHGQGKVTFEDLKAETLRREQSQLVRVDHVRDYAPGKRYTTDETIAQERDILRRILATKDTQKQLESWTPEAVQKRYAHLNDGHGLNDAQAKTVSEVLSSRDTFSGLQGMAGVGKTTTLKAIKPALEAHGYEVIGLAATSGAVKEMQNSGLDAKTLQLHLAQQEHPSTKPRYFIVDEASLASTRMVHEFMRKMGPEDRVLFVGDTRQHESIEAGRIYAQMREAGMADTTLSHIVRQRNSPELKAVVENLSTGKTDEAVKLLTEQGRVHQIENKHERYAAIAKEYVNSTGKTLIVSPDNESRQALNQAVCEQLKLSGPSFTQHILVARQDLTKEDRKVGTVYHEGDVIKFHKANKTVGVEKGDYLTVVAVDKNTNQLTVKHGDATKTYNPERAYGVQVYQRAERTFTEGERVQLTAPWRNKGIANRETGILERLDDKGNVILKLDKDDKRVQFNLKEMKHLDYGYAVTSFSSQGTTVQKVLINVATEDSRVRKLIDQRFGYVAVSRAELDAQVFTDKADNLARSLARTQDKHQALSPAEVQGYRNDASIRNTNGPQPNPTPAVPAPPPSQQQNKRRGQSMQLGA
jgi:conjugative relaxase-like TrwC/TraI family protein